MLRYFVLRGASDSFLWHGDMVAWLAPPGHVAILMIPALVFAAAALISPQLAPQRFVVAVLATVAIYSFALRFTQIHHLASFALSLGLGLQVARTFAHRPAQMRRWLTRSGIAIAAASVVAAMAMPIAARRAEHRALSVLPAAAQDSPNVLLVILDAVRASRLHLYGYAEHTSGNIERFASEGIVFDRAMATSSWTLASLASMMTGRYPTSLSADWTHPLDEKEPVLPEVLQQRGYATGIFSGNLNYLTRETGLGRGAIHFDDFRPSLAEMLLTVSLSQSTLVKDAYAALRNRDAGALLRTVAAFNWARPAVTLTHQRKPVQNVARAFLDWQRTTGARPWFAMLNFFDAHAPYKPQAPFDTMFADGPAGDYDGAVATIDRELGRMLDELRARGVLDRTIVIVTADHGELLGEHGWEHGQSLYRHLLHVPLVIRAPGRVPHGVRVRHTISLRDVAATILDLIEPSSETQVLGGESLRGAWDTTADTGTPSRAFAALTKEARSDPDDPPFWVLFSLVDDSLHYLRSREGKELLFDVRTDVDERKNLTTTAIGRSVVGVMRAQVDSAMREDR